MCFNVFLIVLCLLINYCLVEGLNRKYDKYENRDPYLEELDTLTEDQINPTTLDPRFNFKQPGYDTTNFEEQRLPKEDKLKSNRLTGEVSYNNKGNNTAMIEFDRLNLDDKIPRDAGIKIMYNGPRNIFMSVNPILNFGFIWDGVSGVIALFNTKTGATFVRNGLTWNRKFLGYILQDITNTINTITIGTYEIGMGTFNLFKSVVRIIIDSAVNLVTVFKPLLDVVKSLLNSLGLGKGFMTILEPILGAVRTVTSSIVNIFSTILRKMGGLFDGRLFSAISGLRGLIGNTTKRIYDAVKKITRNIFGPLIRAINGVGSVFKKIQDGIRSILSGGNSKQKDDPYAHVNTSTIIDEDNTYANKFDNIFQYFIQEDNKNADLTILYKGGKDNIVAFYNRIADLMFILSGNPGHIAIFHTNIGDGINTQQNSINGSAIQLPGFLTDNFVGPNAKNVSDAIIKLNRAVDNLNSAVSGSKDTGKINETEMSSTLKKKGVLNSIWAAKDFVVVPLKNLVKALLSMIRPILGVASTLIPFVLNIPSNLISGIISLIASVLKIFLGLLLPEFLIEGARKGVIVALEGLVKILFSSVFVPISEVSISVNAALLVLNTAADILNLP